MIGELFGTLKAKIVGAIGLAMILTLGIVMWRADAISKQRDHYRDAYSMEQARHAVTRGSVELLTKTIEGLNAQAEARAQEFEKARRMAAQREKELSASRVASGRVIARLEALSGQEGKCAVPDELRELAEGL